MLFFASKRSIGSPAAMIEIFLILLSIVSLISVLLSIRSTIELLRDFSSSAAHPQGSNRERIVLR
jgi:hypothetical protein